MNKVIYEYSILRYVPDIERGEFVNVGLIMMCKRYRWIHTRIILNRERISGFFPEADIRCLERQIKAFEGSDIPDPSLPVEERYRWMVATKSAIIQCSPSHPGILCCPDEATQWEIKDALLHLFDRLLQRLI